MDRDYRAERPTRGKARGASKEHSPTSPTQGESLQPNSWARSTDAEGAPGTPVLSAAARDLQGRRLDEGPTDLELIEQALEAEKNEPLDYDADRQDPMGREAENASTTRPTIEAPTEDYYTGFDELLGIDPVKGDGLDGAGPFASEVAGPEDYATWAAAMTMANSASWAGLTHAGAHMRHFLAGSGSALTLDLEEALADTTSFPKYLQEKADLEIAHALATIQPGTPQQEAFESAKDRKGHYFRQEDSKDWYFAVGGHTAWWVGYWIYVPSADGGGKLNVELELFVYDRYNWDLKKGVFLLDNTPLAGLPVVVPDNALGELHRTGLAKEFEMLGSTSRTFETTVDSPYTSTATTSESTALAREGGRSDPTRTLR